MKSRRIQTKKIYEEVADSLITLIKNGELKAGDRLDSVDQLAEIFDVSRSAVREALSGMRAMGLLEMRQGEGTFVTNFNATNFSLPVTAGLLMKKEDVKELYEVRKILEVGAASSAAINHQAADLVPIENAIEEMKRAKVNGEVGEGADMRFHFAIVEATHNEILISLMQSISTIMINILRETREVLMDAEENPDLLIHEHELIFEAIKNRQPDEAGKYMLAHLANVEKTLEKYVNYRN